MSDDGLMGPPWQIDYVEAARTYRDSLPAEVRDSFREALIDILTAKDPYRPGEHVPVEPVRSTRFRGPHVLFFDSSRGWARFVFIRRTADPQIVVEELFWQ
ncbi:MULTISPECIES: hypothetical protein [Streptomyces]|uniref:Type II toxin-antitoxin system RelE/ParE family toxin n=1 Tax=Streptomyces nondiastaticus TaxID=3154512 RepID=A0ABW6TWH7_9ACTN|nr:hypothetical protein [Streptomyces sp. VNUA116]WKU44588.1 hypothetical protein Q3V23_11090 [Streptomyces sp. VNUA116]